MRAQGKHLRVNLSGAGCDTRAAGLDMPRACLAKIIKPCENTQAALVLFLPPPTSHNRRWPPHRKNPEDPLTKMAEELGDEDLVDYEEDEVVDDKPADEVKK